MVVRPSYDRKKTLEEKEKTRLLGEGGSGSARGDVGEVFSLVYLVCFVSLFEQRQLQQDQVVEEQEVHREESQICVFYRCVPYDQCEKKKFTKKTWERFCRISSKITR